MSRRDWLFGLILVVVPRWSTNRRGMENRSGTTQSILPCQHCDRCTVWQEFGPSRRPRRNTIRSCTPFSGWNTNFGTAGHCLITCSPSAACGSRCCSCFGFFASSRCRERGWRRSFSRSIRCTSNRLRGFRKSRTRFRERSRSRGAAGYLKYEEDRQLSVYVLRLCFFVVGLMTKTVDRDVAGGAVDRFVVETWNTLLESAT